MKKLISFFSFLLVTSLPLLAQTAGSESTPELETDRPTEAQGATVVPKSTVQIETGLRFEKDEKDGTTQKELLYPETLVRIGVLKNAELRLNAAFKQEKEKYGASDLSSSAKGLSDVRIGAKVAVFEGKGAIPEIGVLASLTLPVGHTDFKPPHVAPAGRLLFNSKLSDKIDLNYNIGYQKIQEEEYTGQALYAITATLEVTDELKYFVEVFGQKPKGDRAEHQLDSGLMFTLLPNLQLDIIGGIHLNHAAPDAFAGGGLSWRLPQ